ncbi:PREDICTED: sphingosine kinase B-like isoform X2 [Trachymyrmex septentrionalis]|uniref:sphingosine kinase B-like isoform X2 n=1 Tax=Trachymyrmex septentrionalis TaxID=34720 RepID=UPI00084EE3CB|nr:PREDICTED: sphingosine kinase B-like isoform X2 [Trachymyrmex septentrionalis]
MKYIFALVQVLTLIWLVALAFPQRDWSGNVVDDSIIFNDNDEANSSTPSSTTQRTINNNNNNTNTTNNNCPCSATAEYNPVCGTDNVTYWNIGRFNCAKNCNPQLEIRVIRSCEPYIQLSRN